MNFKNVAPHNIPGLTVNVKDINTSIVIAKEMCRQADTIIEEIGLNKYEKEKMYEAIDRFKETLSKVENIPVTIDGSNDIIYKEGLIPTYDKELIDILEEYKILMNELLGNIRTLRLLLEKYKVLTIDKSRTFKTPFFDWFANNFKLLTDTINSFNISESSILRFMTSDENHMDLFFDSKNLPPSQIFGFKEPVDLEDPDKPVDPDDPDKPVITDEYDRTSILNEHYAEGIVAIEDYLKKMTGNPNYEIGKIMTDPQLDFHDGDHRLAPININNYYSNMGYYSNHFYILMNYDYQYDPVRRYNGYITITIFSGGSAGEYKGQMSEELVSLLEGLIETQPVIDFGNNEDFLESVKDDPIVTAVKDAVTIQTGVTLRNAMITMPFRSYDYYFNWVYRVSDNIDNPAGDHLPVSTFNVDRNYAHFWWIGNTPDYSFANDISGHALILATTSWLIVANDSTIGGVHNIYKLSLVNSVCKYVPLYTSSNLPNTTVRNAITALMADPRFASKKPSTSTISLMTSSDNVKDAVNDLMDYVIDPKPMIDFILHTPSVPYTRSYDSIMKFDLSEKYKKAFFNVGQNYNMEVLIHGKKGFISYEITDTLVIVKLDRFKTNIPQITIYNDLGIMLSNTKQRTLKIEGADNCTVEFIIKSSPNKDGIHKRTSTMIDDITLMDV